MLDTRLTDLSTVKELFLPVYNMPLKLEQAGKTIDALEMRVTIIGERLGYASKPLLVDNIGQTIDGSI